MVDSNCMARQFQSAEHPPHAYAIFKDTYPHG